MLMRFDPFADFDRWTRQMWNTGRPQAFMPVDAYRTDEKLWLMFDLPGVDPESIDVQVEDSTLTIKAERRWQPETDAQIVMSERPQGTFTRQFYLGEGLDTDRIEAGYDHGVLTISIPVAEQAKPKKISVGARDKALTG